ncbi:Isochorismatase-like protein [Podospora didyma]|uniref:Isochorismatase-like protein n=1 Tax=Podospora didyma TaxID=330526 RepID=A0AAE0N6Q4_9PEZI|nr:Isochorismatase-like protein [Podospora didyma]
MSSPDPEIKVIGGKNNFWLFRPDEGQGGSYDLTHPPTPSSPLIFPRIPLETTKERIIIDPAKTALVVVDFQNFFLSPLLPGRPVDGAGLEAVGRLVKHAIPACRKAGIPIVWLGWGLTDDDIEDMPPAIVKAFARPGRVPMGQAGGLGSDIGKLTREDGTSIQGGRMLMRDQWNTAFYPSLVAVSEPERDITVHKNRLSGFWGSGGDTEIEKTLKSRGIRTLLFSGCNTDQCVGGSLQDAFSKGWDCLMLSDVCATSSPAFAQQMVEYNCEGAWGFVLTCEQLAEGVRNMQTQ